MCLELLTLTLWKTEVVQAKELEYVVIPQVRLVKGDPDTIHSLYHDRLGVPIITELCPSHSGRQIYLCYATLHVTVIDIIIITIITLFTQNELGS